MVDNSFDNDFRAFVDRDNILRDRVFNRLQEIRPTTQALVVAWKDPAGAFQYAQFGGSYETLLWLASLLQQNIAYDAASIEGGEDTCSTEQEDDKDTQQE